MNIVTSNRIFLSQVPGKLASDEPFIFWDTCALLNLVRIPLIERKELTLNMLQSYEFLLNEIEMGHVQSIASEVVLSEFSHHVDNIVNQLHNQEQRIKDEVKSQTDYMANAQHANVISQKIEFLDVSNKVIKMVRKIWRKTYILRGQKSFATNADYRTRNYITPSRGKESYKDSYIWVSFISLLNKLQPTEICYFFTANPADFAVDRKTPTLHPDLATEMPASGNVCFKVGILEGNIRTYIQNHP